MKREKILGYTIVILFLEMAISFWLGLLSMPWRTVYGIIFLAIMVICICSLLFIDLIPYKGDEE